MTYATETAAISRQPCQMVIVTLDTCTLTYGVGACTATASGKCYNTYYTCRAQGNFDKTDKEYKFTSFQSPLPFSGVLPYLQDVKLLPTVIGKKITVKGRVKVGFVDELHDDVGIDPYYATRSSIQGEFWKKLIARNPNYKGRSIKVYDGYVGLAEGAFEQRWQGTIDKITIKKGKVSLDCIDYLTDLKKTSYPDKTQAELNVNLTDSTATIVLTTLDLEDESEMAGAGYIRIDDEIIQYTSVTTASNQLNGCTRGKFRTTAVEHSSGTRIGIVKYFPPTNPFVLLKEIWNDAGGSWSADFDTTAWTKWQSWPREDVDFAAVITEDDDLTCEDAFWEIADILDLMIWQDERQQITVRRNIANDPDNSYTDITDSAHIIDQTGSVDYNDKERKTRIYHFWQKSAIGDFKKTSSYSKIDIPLLANEESANGFNEVSKDEIFNRWLSTDFTAAYLLIPFIAAVSKRRLINRGKARALITVAVELKDEGIKTGGLVSLATDERLDIDGNSIAIKHIVIKRDKKGGKIALTLKELPLNRMMIIAPAGHPTYTNSSDAQREYGYISSATEGKMLNGDEGYYIG